MYHQATNSLVCIQGPPRMGPCPCIGSFQMVWNDFKPSTLSSLLPCCSWKWEKEVFLSWLITVSAAKQHHSNHVGGSDASESYYDWTGLNTNTYSRVYRTSPVFKCHLRSEFSNLPITNSGIIYSEMCKEMSGIRTTWNGPLEEWSTLPYWWTIQEEGWRSLLPLPYSLPMFSSERWKRVNTLPTAKVNNS